MGIAAATVFGDEPDVKCADDAGMVNMYKGIVAGSGIGKPIAKIPVIGKIVSCTFIAYGYIKRRATFCGIYCKAGFGIGIYQYAVAVVRGIATVIRFQCNIISGVAKGGIGIIRNGSRRREGAGNAIAEIPEELDAIQLARGIGECYG